MIRKVDHFRMVIIVLFIIVLMTACSSGGSYQIISGSVEASEQSITGSYHNFSGHYFKKVSLQAGTKLAVNLTTDTEKGQLRAEVLDPDGNLLLDVKGQKQPQTRELEINKQGSYKLRVTGYNHGGSFTLAWQVE